MDTLRQQLFGMNFSSQELEMETEWPASVIEDYLSIADNIEKISDYIDVTSTGHSQTISATTYETIPTDGVILADGTANVVAISLDADPQENQRHTIKCINATFAVTVVPNGNNVDGSGATIPLILNQAITIVFSGGAWWIV